MSSGAPLVGLPGAQADPGTGPVVQALLDALLADAAALAPSRTPIGQALAEYRAHRAAWYGELVGPLLVPAPAAIELTGALTDGDLGLAVTVVTGEAGNAALDRVRAARSALEGTRAHLVGIHLPLPPGNPARAARATLDALDLTVPAWLILGNRPGWQDALDVLAADGAECAAAMLDGEAGFAAEADLAEFIRLAIDRDVTFTVHSEGDLPAVRAAADSGAGPPGLLNLLCTVRAALNGADLEELIPILTESDPAPLCAALRRMSEADAAVARAFLASLPARVGSMTDELHGLGLIEPSAA